MGRGRSETYPLSDEVSDSLYPIFASGKSLSEVRALRPQFSLGQIVDAAIRNDWHQRAKNEISLAWAKIQVKKTITKAESADMITDIVVALKRRYGQKIVEMGMSNTELDATEISGILKLIERCNEIMDAIDLEPGQATPQVQQHEHKHIHVVEQKPKTIIDLAKEKTE
jgi:hypothetical protein